MGHHVDDKPRKQQGRVVKNGNECNTRLEKVAKARSNRVEDDGWADTVVW